MASLSRTAQDRKRTSMIAQVMFRARKVHVQQLENRVMELQKVLEFTAEQLAVVCAPLVRMRDQIMHGSVPRGGRYHHDCLKQAVSTLEAVLARRLQQASTASLVPTAIHGIGQLKCRL
ncbi:hypothetical protein CONPUDRAFT_157659 [Coniophora puteana RWD-64-598 SS2]|uniref:BZIP domain-containing protein n=1 Tax=Coniophora puteana (strain RWD-64-598) TaxID=741705 RepID=A0A5M3MER5_CONPW|nr:uncharacterized protein CONPUDRAFT_157659 [Coniophora puteana RWD-64-598 SS2]EIW77410.1 hypothetical protein CONPUDRAFT_157659 [Coniophora puteana RWD-64-598 SS2]